MRKSVWLILIFFLFSIVACGQGELSRSKAKSLLKDNIGDGQMTVNIFTGEFKNYSYGPFNQEYNLTKFLSEKGYLTFECTDAGGMEWKVTLQPSIKPYITKEEPFKENMGRFHPMVATINIGKKSIKDITGIKQDEESALLGCKAVVEYTYKYDLTTIGKEIPENILRGLGIPLQPTGEACFAKYDDGWRLQK